MIDMRVDEVRGGSPGVSPGVSPPNDDIGFERVWVSLPNDDIGLERVWVSPPNDEQGEAGFERVEPFGLANLLVT